jgi:hypothetical protein
VEAPKLTVLFTVQLAGGKHLHPQQLVQQLTLDITVLAEDQYAREAVHNLLEVLLFLRWEGNATQLAWWEKGNVGGERREE